MNRRILLLSAYDAISHKLWRNTLAEMFPQFSWTQLALPPRHFSWRVRGNSLSWGLGSKKVLNGNYDLLIATSMVDLASLRGFVPGLASLPTVVYFHENQFEYPLQDPEIDTHSKHAQETRLQAQLTSIYSALCADEIVFNSQFNRTTFLNGVKQLLQKLPDCVPSGIVEQLTASQIIPVPLARTIADVITSTTDKINSQPAQVEPLRIAWNHRWEYDKGPHLLLKIVKALIKEPLQVQFFIFGQQFRQKPAQFNELEQLLGGDSDQRLAHPHHLGYVDDPNTYHSLLAQCDIVLSTALHDFQGLAIVEGCALGCTPLVPDDLAYPEYLAGDFLYSISGEDRADQAVRKIKKWAVLKSQGTPLPTADVSAFSAAELKKSYLALFEKTW